MSDALGALVDVLVHAVLWRVVGELLRDQPLAVVVVVGLVAAGTFLVRRSGRRVRREAP